MGQLAKRGFVYSFIAMLIAILILFSYSVSHHDTERITSDSLVSRIHTLNDFIIDVNQDLSNGIKIVSTRTLLGFQEYIAEEGLYLGDFEQRFTEGFLNGTLAGQSLNLLNDSTFTNWTNRIESQARLIAIRTNFTLYGVEVRQQTPWSINVTVSLRMEMEDLRGAARWDLNRSVSSLLSIRDFEDPVYLVNTQGKVTNTIRITNVTPLVAGNDVTNLMIHANNSYYLPSNYSPSYVMRLEGNFSPSPMGIESLVYVPALQSQGISAETRSVVDVVYFGNQTTTHHRINDTPDWFRLDDERLTLYGVEDLTT